MIPTSTVCAGLRLLRPQWRAPLAIFSRPRSALVVAIDDSTTPSRLVVAVVYTEHCQLRAGNSVWVDVADLDAFAAAIDAARALRRAEGAR